MLSIWERNSFITYDHIVLGSGIVGLTAAYYIKKRFPSHSVLVLERGLLPTGASTKNAGFACMGSPTELLDDLSRSTEQEVLELFLLRKKGLERLRGLLGDERIGYAANGSYELLFEKDMAVVEQLDRLNQLLYNEIKVNAFTLASEKIRQFQFNGTQVKAMIENNCEGEIDTGLMMKSLIQLVLASGVEIKTGAEVISFLDATTSVDVVCRNPLTETNVLFKASTLSICNNGFASKLLPNYDLIPGRGQVMITKPIEGLPFKGIFHFNDGYYYFREYKGCVLFGGGRNLDIENETATTFELNKKIQDDLQNKLRELILPKFSFETDLQWTGIMGFGKSKRPILKKHSEHITVGIRMGGMGVAIGSEIGFELAAMI